MDYSGLFGEATGIAQTDAEKVLRRMKQRWRNGPKTLRVVQSVADVPAELRREGMRGVYDSSTDSVYIVADNISSADEAAFVALHEVVGHRGVEGVLGKKGVTEYFNRLATARARDIRKYATAHGMAFGTQSERRRAARPSAAWRGNLRGYGAGHATGRAVRRGVGDSLWAPLFPLPYLMTFPENCRNSDNN